jgi:serpin B
MKKVIAICCMLMMVGCTQSSEVESTISFNDESMVLEKSDIQDLGNKLAPPITELGIEMMNRILKDHSASNVLVSPLSLSIALEMLQNGAEEETKEEILKVIGRMNENMDASNKVVEGMYDENKALLTYLNNKSNDELKVAVANSMWMRDDMTFQKSFVDALSGSYDAQAFNVNFMKESTLSDMNQWVEDKTNGMLKDTLKSLDPNTLLVLMNTVYFKGAWENEFWENSTQEKDFYVTSDNIKKVDMMYQKESFHYIEDKHTQIVHLPYKGNMEMILVLPSIDIESWLNDLTAEDMIAIINREGTSREDVQLSLPKFEFEVNNNLNDLLQDMGMIKAFDAENAEFSKVIEEDGQVWVSKIFQNAKIILDEKGTEAAAVTVVEVAEESAMPESEPIAMTCDRPFFFVIKDNTTGIPLFMGVYRAEKK